MTDEQILEVAKTCGFIEMIGERDDETDGVYYECWEEQLLKFARAIRQDGRSCPHIVTTDEGTSYCKLAQQTADLLARLQ